MNGFKCISFAKIKTLGWLKWLARSLMLECKIARVSPADATRPAGGTWPDLIPSNSRLASRKGGKTLLSFRTLSLSSAEIGPSRTAPLEILYSGNDSFKPAALLYCSIVCKPSHCSNLTTQNKENVLNNVS